MPVYRVTIEGETYTVDVPNPRERPVRAIVNGETIEVHLEPGLDPVLPARAPVSQVTRAPAPLVRPAPSMVGAASGEIKAPLPGTIVSVSVAVGDRVEAGQELCLIEAMKMNNPIRSPKAGTVKQIMVVAGQQIQHGMPLFVVEG